MCRNWSYPNLIILREAESIPPNSDDCKSVSPQNTTLNQNFRLINQSVASLYNSLIFLSYWQFHTSMFVNFRPVWPVKSRQMSIKVAKKWFH